MRDRLHYLNPFQLLFPKCFEIEQIAVRIKACQKLKHRYSAKQIEAVELHCISQQIRSHLVLGLYPALLILIVSEGIFCAFI